MSPVPRFFLSQADPCPYLPDQTEQKIFTLLSGEGADDLHDLLSAQGFRRSQLIAYRPACKNCSACTAIRICVSDFIIKPKARRFSVEKLGLTPSHRPLSATREQYDLFSLYVKSRHKDGAMSSMTFEEFQAMIEDSQVSSRLTEYRDANNTLIAAALIDRLSDGLSMVYSFYSVESPLKSLGTMMILHQITSAQNQKLSYLYLGYWIKNAPTMAYKARFLPQQRLINGQWQTVTKTSVEP